MGPLPGQNPQLLSSCEAASRVTASASGSAGARRPEKRVTARSQAPQKKWTGLHFPRKRARNTHIPSLLVVNRWAADGESGSHYDFWCRHDVWIMIFHQVGERITSIISIVWYFTTKSDGIWNLSLTYYTHNSLAVSEGLFVCNTPEHTEIMRVMTSMRIISLLRK